MITARAKLSFVFFLLLAMSQLLLGAEEEQGRADAPFTLNAGGGTVDMNVSSFNQLLASWPAGMVGSSRGHSPKVFFQADEKKKEDVEMAF